MIRNVFICTRFVSDEVLTLLLSACPAGKFFRYRALLRSVHQTRSVVRLILNVADPCPVLSSVATVYPCRAVSIQFIDLVVIKNKRPVIDKTWPPLTRLVLPEAWDKDPKSRPDMKRVAIMIRGDLNDMTTDARVRQRTQHMEDRSSHSMDGTIDP